MPKKRKVRRKLNWGPILLLALLVNVWLGLTRSPITSLVRIRVDGALEEDRARLREILSVTQDIPMAQIQVARLETAVLANPAVRSTDFRRNILGRGYLRVDYRRPVLRVKDTAGLVMDREGVFFTLAAPPPGLPVLSLPKGRSEVLATLAGTWSPVAIGEMAELARQKWPDRDLWIDIDERGVVCLNMDSGRAILGSARDLPKKLGVLEERLKANRDELRQVEALNLTAPDEPAIVPRRGAQRP